MGWTAQVSALCSRAGSTLSSLGLRLMSKPSRPASWLWLGRSGSFFWCGFCYCSFTQHPTTSASVDLSAKVPGFQRGSRWRTKSSSPGEHLPSECLSSRWTYGYDISTEELQKPLQQRASSGFTGQAVFFYNLAEETSLPETLLHPVLWTTCRWWKAQGRFCRSAGVVCGYWEMASLSNGDWTNIFLPPLLIERFCLFVLQRRDNAL